jgi:hypothetical protein
MMILLIITISINEVPEPVGETSTWKDFLDTHFEGVHDIAFEIK